jgi:hypothetical protein
LLLADAGFAATGLMAPDDDGGGDNARSRHRSVAFASMGTALVSYVIMLPDVVKR